MKTIVSIIGLPGAGKTTISGLVAEILGAPVLSTGEALRAASAQDSTLASALANGQMGPEALVRRLVDDFLHGSNVAILDGYPRHDEQAGYLLTFKARLVVGYLAIESSVAVARIRQRPARGDDADAAVQQRLTRERLSLQKVVTKLGDRVIRLDARHSPRSIARDLAVHCR